MFNGKKILFLSPHTDDVELGCGALLSNLTNYSIVKVIALSAPNEQLVLEFHKAINSIGITNRSLLNFDIRKFPERRQEILEKFINERNMYNPDIVIGPSINDNHQDHQVVYNEMVRAFKNDSSILSYELPWNNTNFNTQFFHRFGESEMRRKESLLKVYESQKDRFYFKNGIMRSLATLRGMQVKSEFAEVFEVVRWID